MEGNASVYQVNPVSRISGDGRSEFLGTWGADFDQKGAGRKEVGSGTGGAAQSVRGNCKSYPVSRTTSEGSIIYYKN